MTFPRLNAAVISARALGLVVGFWAMPLPLFGDDPNAPRTGAISSPDEVFAALTVADGYRVNLFASEERAPLHNPLAMAFDAGGRLWVATSPTYPHYDPGHAPKDKLVVFEDTDRDGVADRHTVFADDLYIPTGFAIDTNGVFVAQQPNLWFLQDTDGDDVADRKRVVLHGFGTEDSHHALSAFTWGPDGAFYFNEGVFHHSQIETPYGPRRAVDAAVFRYKPSTQRLDVISHRIYNNPWGHAFDRWGQSVFSDASDGEHYDFASVIAAFDYPRKTVPAPGFLRRGRPLAGNVIVSSRHFPDDVQGTHLNNQCIGLHGTIWDRLVPEGSGWRSEPLPPLIQSSDFSFRPVAAAFGPDGALYVLDWANQRIGHMQYSHRDPNRDHGHGRIWRITAEGRPLLEPPFIDGAPVATLLELLRTHENHVRHFARRELQTRPATEVEANLAIWIDLLERQNPDYEHLLLEALWIYQGRDIIHEDLLRRLLEAREPRARAAAVRVLRHWIQAGFIETPVALALLSPRVEDPDARVRLEAVSACGFVPSRDAAGLALLASELPADKPLEAVLKQTLAVLAKYGEPPSGVGRRFRLRQLDAATLSAEPLDEAVAKAQLERPDLAPEKHQKAIRFLARRGNTDDATTVVRLLGRLDQDGGIVDVAASLLERLDVDRLQSREGELVNLLRGQREPTRRAAATSLLRLRQNLRRVVAAGAPLTLVLEAFPRIPEKEIRERLYPHIVPYLEVQNPRDVRRAAIQAVVHVDGQREQTFRYLAALALGDDLELASEARRAMNEIPTASWPEGFDRFRYDEIDVQQYDRGQAVYLRAGVCNTCHQVDGRGIPGAFPSLVASPWVIGPPETLIRLVLHGLAGPIEVDGRTYASVMEPLGGMLDDAEIAAVLSYVRNSWGNRASPVSSDTVARIRSEYVTREHPWTVPELRRVGLAPRNEIITTNVDDLAATAVLITVGILAVLVVIFGIVIYSFHKAPPPDQPNR